jgi:hypothetical protein
MPLLPWGSEAYTLTTFVTVPQDVISLDDSSPPDSLAKGDISVDGDSTAVAFEALERDFQEVKLGPVSGQLQGRRPWPHVLLNPHARSSMSLSETKTLRSSELNTISYTGRSNDLTEVRR